MARQKKTINVKEENKEETIMSDEVTLDNIQTEIDLARKELEKTKLEIEEKKKEMVTSSKRDLEEVEKELIAKQISRSNERKAKENVIDKLKAFDNERVTGKFINRRAPGQPAKLAYIKYEDDPVKWYEFQDGKVYTIPRGFADQINEYYHTPHFIQKEGAMDPNAPSSVIHDVDTSNKKYAFLPLGF